MESAPLFGTFLHTIGAGSAALCYSPQKFLHRWSWQTYWLTQAFFCWLLLPWIGAYLSLGDHFWTVLGEAPKGAMLLSYLYGVIYGVGGIAFGVSIRYIGFSLTYAIAIGFSCLIGTLFMPLINGVLAEKLQQDGGLIVVLGVILGFFAMILTGIAGFRKERELAEDGKETTFNAHIGLPLCVLAGVLSAVFSFSLDAATPIAEVAAKYGAGQNRENIKYIFSNNGAFTTTLIYIIYLMNKNKTWGEFLRTPDGSAGGLIRNYVLSFATGLMWYTQFFFYGRGHVLMGDFKFSSWAIHMIILILLSSGFGVLIGEWKGARRKTLFDMGVGLALLVGAVGLITYGNYLGNLVGSGH
ncbi:MAG: L-rhamnose/proton symporter RhaT [Puniceicoccaceae bacterium]